VDRDLVLVFGRLHCLVGNVRLQVLQELGVLAVSLLLWLLLLELGRLGGNWSEQEGVSGEDVQELGTLGFADLQALYFLSQLSVSQQELSQSALKASWVSLHELLENGTAAIQLEHQHVRTETLPLSVLAHSVPLLEEALQMLLSLPLNIQQLALQAELRQAFFENELLDAGFEHGHPGLFLGSWLSGWLLGLRVELVVDVSEVEELVEPADDFLLGVADFELVGEHSVLEHFAAGLVGTLHVHVTPAPSEPCVQQHLQVVCPQLGAREPQFVVLAPSLLSALLPTLRVVDHSPFRAVIAPVFRLRVVVRPGEQD
jgi:hypothetical protein